MQWGQNQLQWDFPVTCACFVKLYFWWKSHHLRKLRIISLVWNCSLCKLGTAMLFCCYLACILGWCIPNEKIARLATRVVALCKLVSCVCFLFAQTNRIQFKASPWVVIFFPLAFLNSRLVLQFGQYHNLGILLMPKDEGWKWPIWHFGFPQLIVGSLVAALQ